MRKRILFEFFFIRKRKVRVYSPGTQATYFLVFHSVAGIEISFLFP
jgi:hypothetical protein